MNNLEINQEAPDFQMEDFNGNEFILNDFREKKNVLILLNRGFIWPFCRKHMMQLHQDYNKFIEKDTIIVVIGPEDKESFNKYWKENNFKFYGISDKAKTILELYGQKVKLLKLGRMPGQMLIDKKGILRYVNYGNSMDDIPENSEILNIIDNL